MATSNKAVNTGEKQATNGSWKPGKSGNLNGRPKGARNKLSEEFFRDLYNVWKKHGVKALEKTFKDHPSLAVGIVGRLMPKEAELDVEPKRRFAGFQFIVSGKDEDVEDQFLATSNKKPTPRR